MQKCVSNITTAYKYRVGRVAINDVEVELASSSYQRNNVFFIWFAQNVARNNTHITNVAPESKARETNTAAEVLKMTTSVPV